MTKVGQRYSFKVSGSSTIQEIISNEKGFCDIICIQVLKKYYPGIDIVGEKSSWYISNSCFKYLPNQDKPESIIK